MRKLFAAEAISHTQPFCPWKKQGENPAFFMEDADNMDTMQNRYNFSF